MSSSPGRVLPREGAPFPLPRRAEAEPLPVLPALSRLEGKGRNGDPPPGEGPGANAAGRLPRRPAPRPPPAPPAASAAARRSSAAFPAQSVSPRRWVSGGRWAGARGCEQGASRRRGATSWTPQPCRSRAAQEFSLGGLTEWGCPRETRGALQGPDRRVASLERRFGRLGTPPLGGATRPALSQS